MGKGNTTHDLASLVNLLRNLVPLQTLEALLLHPVLYGSSSVLPAIWKPSTFKSTGFGAGNWGRPWPGGLVRWLKLFHLHFLF